MTIPKTTKITLPLLKFLKDGNEHSMGEAGKILALDFGLTDDEKNELQKLGKTETKFGYQIAWSCTHLLWAELVERTRTAHIKITSEGLDFLKENPPDLTENYLTNRFPKFAQRRRRGDSDELWKLSELTTFIETEMNMQYNYQPVLILSLLKCPNYTASKNLLVEQLWKHNNFSDKEYVEPLKEAIQATGKTNNRNIVSDLGNNQIKLNLEPLDSDKKKDLINICYDQIAKWDSENTISKNGKKVKIDADARFFLLLPNEKGSLQLLDNQYTHDNWSEKGNQKPAKQGEVKIGDIILVYFAAKSIMHAQLLKKVYKVIEISENHERFDLEPVKDLFGIQLQKIRELIETKKIGESFKSIGQPLRITEISRDDYRDVLLFDNELKPTINDVNFTSVNSMIKNIMKEHKKGPFTNLTDFLKNKEVEGYKNKILKNTENIFNNKNTYTENLKVACKYETVGNHIFRLNGGPEESEARILYAITDEDEKIQQELEQKLSDFFNAKTEIDFGNRWDSLVYVMQSIKSSTCRPDFLFLCYLAFLQNHELHIPFTPTKADSLFKFFGFDFEKISDKTGLKNWHNYSALLELANELRLKLADHPELDLIDIQGYMWIIANAIKKENKSTGADLIKNDQGYDIMNLERLYKILERKKQIIFYGPPGTGKTFSAYNLEKYILSKNIPEPSLTNSQNWIFVTSPEHLEILKREKVWGSIAKLSSIKEKIHAGDKVIFYVKGKRSFKSSFEFVGDWYPSKSGIWIDESTKNYQSQIDLKELDNFDVDLDILKETEIYKSKLESKRYPENKIVPLMLQASGGFPANDSSPISEADYKKICSITDSIGTTTSKVQNFSKNVTFHQSYSYEDFVEGIRPIIEDKKVIYKPIDGIFKEICESARKDPQNKYVLTIDEINRGNVSKIFGELITLIESDKRKEEYQVTLPYTRKSFWIPENLFIIGTMNTADRSIAQLDTALRRRFAFEELMPDSGVEGLDKEIEGPDKKIGGISLKKLLDELNDRIRSEGAQFREKQIGHSYFMKIKDIEDLRITFAVEIVPLLQEYFYQNYKKLEEKILNSDFVDSSKDEIKREWKTDDKIFQVAIDKILKSN